MRLRALSVLLAVVFAVVRVAGAEGGGEWTPLLFLRLGNIDGMDAEDGDLARFLKSIRNDGRFIPPVRTLVGPEVRNPTFYGLSGDAWMELAVLVSNVSPESARVWVFPVESRNEYMSQLAHQGMSEYEGMDGVTVLRETGADGGARVWYLEWLPGGVGVFGAERSAVSEVRRLYAENAAARGILAGAGGRYLAPDLMLRLNPAGLMRWRDGEPGVYRWRGAIERLARDLVDYWRPAPARAALIRSLADEFALAPRDLAGADLSLWFEPEGVEWRLRVEGDLPKRSQGQLALLRRIPERTALAYAMAVSPDSFAAIAGGLGRLALGAVGGVVSRETGNAVMELYGALAAAGPREAVWAWVPPPADRPELGAARLLLAEWDDPDGLERVPRFFEEAAVAGTPPAQTLGQLGWEGTFDREIGVPLAAEVEMRPLGGRDGMAEPVFSGLFAFRRRGAVTALVGGGSREDAEERRLVAEYRAGLAEEAVRAVPGDGGPEVRSAFVRMGPGGASVLGLFSPVRFAQLALVEAADWRPRSPDQDEPHSTRLAREMLEYGSAGAWTMVGESVDNGTWLLNGGMSWRSLIRLSAALGVTESVGLEGEGGARD